MPYRGRLTATLSTLCLCAACIAAPASPSSAGQGPALDWGADLRVRDEYVDGAQTLDTGATGHEQNQIRVRTRIWLGGEIAPGLTVNTRLSAEPRYWTIPCSSKTHLGEKGWEERFALVDLLNIRFTTELAGQSLALTVGRQELESDSWLVCDGTPGDGSWTLFFDAVQATLKAPSGRWQLNLVAINERADAGQHLGSIGNSEAYATSENNEHGLILQARYQPDADTQLSATYLLKENERVSSRGNDATLSTVELGATQTLGAHWLAAAQAAVQWGHKEDNLVHTPILVFGPRDVFATAAQLRATYLLKDALDQKITLGAEYLSGDDPSTPGRDEMFDVLWGRFPRIGDIDAYARSAETGGYAQLTNLIRFGPEWSLTLPSHTSLCLTYQALFAPEGTATRATNPALFAGGHSRGQLGKLVLKQRFSERVNGLLQLEALRQGDFYANRDTLFFMRAEVSCKL